MTTPMRGWYVSEIMGIGVANFSSFANVHYVREVVSEDELSDCPDFTFDTENDGAINE